MSRGRGQRGGQGAWGRGPAPERRGGVAPGPRVQAVGGADLNNDEDAISAQRQGEDGPEAEGAEGAPAEEADGLSAAELAALTAAPAGATTGGAEPLPGVLYLVPTPLGHLGDLSPRAQAVLRGVELLLCEDTRVSRRLTAHLDAHPRLLSCHAHNERGRARQVVDLLAAGRRLALVSDAGTPLISDPGDSVVRAVLDAGLPVCALPGPCAALTALSASGLPAGRFLFVGFLPRAKPERRAALAALRAEPATLLLYESPHRLIDTVEDLAEALGADRAASLAHNLSKRSERHLRGSLGELLPLLRSEAASAPVAGEWCLVVAGAPAERAAPPPPEQAAVARLAAALLAAGLGAKAARGVVQTTFGISKNDAYQAILTAQDSEAPAEGEA